MTNPPLLVGISGKRGSGKSTLAGLLANIFNDDGVEIRPLARPLKAIARDLFGVPESALYGDDEAKQALTHIRQAHMSHWCRVCEIEDSGPAVADIEGDRFLTARELLQQLGTEVFRRIDARCWINSLRADWRRSTAAYMIVDDVRFADEADFIRYQGGVMIRLTRGQDAAADAHASERGLDDYPHFDLVIDHTTHDTAAKVASAAAAFILARSRAT